LSKNGVKKPNFRGFMADKAQAKWNTLRIIFGSGGVKVPIGQHFYNNTHKSTSIPTYNTNILASTSYIRIQKQWKRQNHDILPFRPGGYLLELLWKMPCAT
jgi:hypothetical protein